MEIEMDSSTAQFLHHHQEMSSQTLESMLVCNKAAGAGAEEKKPRPADEAALNCPRCDSTNTKFCYYNNYSLTQPRYFCKSCRRYWTKGGTLRNVPVGGGCRRTTKRPSSSPTSSSSSKRPPPSSSPNQFLPNYHHFPQRGLQSQTNVGGFDQDHFLGGNYQNTPIGGSSSHDQFLGGGGGGGRFLDALRGGFLENGLFHNVYSSFGDKNEMGNVENGGIMGLSNVVSTNQDQLGMNNNNHSSLYHQNDHQEDHAMVKQEGGERRVLWGFPWQIGGSDHQGNVIHEEVDSGRSKNSWTGFGSTWHGLLNSPLM